MCATDTWASSGFTVRPGPELSSWRGYEWQVAGAEDGDGVRLLACAAVALAVVRHGELHVWRGGESTDGREIALARLERSAIFSVVYGAGSLRMRMRLRMGRGLWCPARYVNDDGVVDSLAAGVEVVEGPAHVLVGLEWSVLLVAGLEAEMQVGGVKGPAERVGVLVEDGFADVIDEVLVANGDEGGRGTRSTDPDLARARHGWRRGDGELGSRVEDEVGGGRRRGLAEGRAGAAWWPRAGRGRRRCGGDGGGRWNVIARVGGCLGCRSKRRRGRRGSLSLSLPGEGDVCS